MDEKTENLRDVFIDATGSDTVTERQSESRGSLVDRDDDAVADRVSELIAAMRDRYEFATALDDDAYERVVYGYFDADSEDGHDPVERDAALAAAIGVDEETVRDARLDLHLVDEADRDAPFEYATLKRLLAEGRSVEECAAALDAEPPVVERYVDVARADAASTRANGRFRDEFRDLLTDAEIEGSHASGAREDGLRDATEDIDTDVSL
ncbi:hypothetical protein [Halorubrum sp. DTA98]|uniref:hypothetical protein n=1 Tax=Halorubrum sp. DTA98 TaxID=3402163 RepID=UPI003AAE6FF5